MGDGAGILIQIPDGFYREEMAKQGVTLPPAGEYGVGMVFLPKEHASRLACEQELERTVKAEGQVVLGWRDVPVDDTMPMSPTVQGERAGDPPDLHRPRHGHHGDRRARAQAVRDPQDREPPHPGAQAQARQGILRAVDVGAHGRLQGPAAGRPGRRVLPRPAGRAPRLGAGAGAPALLDQHVPGVGTGSPVPHDRPQRRNQHGQGQRQLAERAYRRDRSRTCSATTCRSSGR